MNSFRSKNKNKKKIKSRCVAFWSNVELEICYPIDPCPIQGYCCYHKSPSLCSMKEFKVENRQRDP